MTKKILIIDLDGTFVNINTFHKWMKFIFIEEVKRFHFISLIKLLKIVFSRYVKHIDHAQMKYMILKISEKKINQKQVSKFVHTLDTSIHPKLLQLVTSTDNTTILATAAPLFYAQTIKDTYGFDFVLATPNTSVSPWKENIKDEKRKNVSVLLESQGLDYKKSILYTDHHDDMSLMECAQKTYLINPSIETKDKLNHVDFHFELFT